MVLKCQGTQHALHAVWMGRPNQAGGLQGCRGVDRIPLAVEGPGHRLRLATEQTKLGAPSSDWTAILNGVQSLHAVQNWRDSTFSLSSLGCDGGALAIGARSCHAMVTVSLSPL